MSGSIGFSAVWSLALAMVFLRSVPGKLQAFVLLFLVARGVRELVLNLGGLGFALIPDMDPAAWAPAEELIALFLGAFVLAGVRRAHVLRPRPLAPGEPGS